MTDTETPRVLTREAILAADDLPRESLFVPEWNGTVWVRTLTGRERDAYEESLRVKRGKHWQVTTADVRAKLACRCVCDEAGQPLFNENDVPALTKKSCAALDRIADVAQRLNHFRDEDIEDLAKNSESGPSESSGSDSV